MRLSDSWNPHCHRSSAISARAIAAIWALYESTFKDACVMDWTRDEATVELTARLPRPPNRGSPMMLRLSRQLGACRVGHATPRLLRGEATSGKSWKRLRGPAARCTARIADGGRPAISPYSRRICVRLTRWFEVKYLNSRSTGQPISADVSSGLMRLVSASASATGGSVGQGLRPLPFG
jgi:hypothetical protein